MTARIEPQTMTDTRTYPWHPRPPRHRAGDTPPSPFGNVPQPDPWAGVRARE